MTVFSQRAQAQVFMPLIMWKGRLATAVCLCRYSKGRLERKGRRKWRGGGGELAERAKRGLKDAGTAVISEQTSPRTERLDLYDQTKYSRGSIVSPGPGSSAVVVHRRLFGDESDLHFWTVASHYLQSFAQARQLSVSAAEGQAQTEGTQPSAQNHLDICHDVLCESSYFQVSETIEEDKVCLWLLSFCGKDRK